MKLANDSSFIAIANVKIVYPNLANKE